MTALSNWLIATTGQGSLWLMAWSWQALILTGCVWLVLNVWRIKSPSLRHHIWLFGLVAVGLFPLCATLAREMQSPMTD